ncbi:chemotaxis protein CheA [Rhodosalinus sp. 5P4]|uniref:chemotaxis protein CheA n=1 Tax=Rhodosalinus sp. 5P4 TaxID=3239196 RepID=UPI003525918D
MAARDSLRDTFFQECEDLLEVMSDGFQRMEAEEADAETVNAVFRAVHSIKGGAGAFGFDTLVGFAHALENVLDDMRNGRVADSAAVAPLLFRAGDRLFDLVEAERSGTPADASSAEHQALLAELTAAGSGTGAAVPPAPVAGTTGAETEADDAGFTPTALTLDLLDDATDAGPQDPDAVTELRFAPTRALYASGNDPVPLLRALADLAPLSCEAELDRLPAWDEAEWDAGYLSWRVRFEVPVARADVEEIFEFVAEDAGLTFGAEPAEPAAPDAPAPSPVATNGEAGPAVRSDGAPRAAAPDQRRSIRVDLERVDRLINLVGELVIAEAMLSQSLVGADARQDPAVVASLGQLKQLSTELQERIMAIRAQSVKPLFQRMGRIVREAAAAVDRDVRLVTEGEATEVDKTVIERLADPLTHMLRNAVDHGIEPPETREAAGKPRQGTVQLSAAHRSGLVVIEISDDGAGIDPARVHAKAVERGLVAPDADLSEQETLNLVFEPGFSTAGAVSSLSGRGVGMDVVRTEIHALGGRVSLRSAPGRGTTVTVSLPLTLAVVEGMLVEVAGETLVVPSTALRETLRANDAAVHRLGAGGPVLSMRGALIPLFDLGAALGYRLPPEEPVGTAILLVESFSGQRVAIAVDRILGQREVVIKGLTENYGQVPGIAAATILGDGRIALIIDVDEVANPERGQRDAESLPRAFGAC